uniref:Uncharacterized protein n=1 Tax=Oryza nivara TaxID=4536 RepID=A0A0E0FXB0_ORYNI
MLGNMKVRGKRTKEPKRLTKSPMKGKSAVTKALAPNTSPLASSRLPRLSSHAINGEEEKKVVYDICTCCETMLWRKAVALMRTVAQLGPLSWSGRYSDTAAPYAQ